MVGTRERDEAAEGTVQAGGKAREKKRPEKEESTRGEGISNRKGTFERAVAFL